MQNQCCWRHHSMIKTMLMFMVVDLTATDDDAMWVMGFML
jgi:hypothetical protein